MIRCKTCGDIRHSGNYCSSCRDKTESEARYQNEVPYRIGEDY